MQQTSEQLRTSGKRIGFVPTMGALHDGHLSLLHTACQHSDVTVMSIFVNPAQFAPHEDFNTYPRMFEKDAAVAREQGCDILFYPKEDVLYPQGYKTFVTVEDLSSAFEGAVRPSHFRGVTTIVCKFFNIVAPHIAVFGQKDVQQVIIIRKMVHDLHFPVRIVVAPTVREHDGLAMSSRNVYLTEKERNDAPLMYQGLLKAQKEYEAGQRSTQKLIQSIETFYAQSDILEPEYISVVDSKSFETVKTITATALIVVVCRTKESRTRLLDNVVVGGAL